MADSNKLDLLTDKIYREGIAKAQKEAKEILSKAANDRDQLLEMANTEAKKIISTAEKEAARLARSMEKELQLNGKQLLSDLKNEIQNMLSKKILKTNTNAAFADVPFLKDIIIEAIKSWKPSDDLQLILPKELEDKLDIAFTNSISTHILNLAITFDDSLKEGFVILKKSNAYKVSFSEDDFTTLFKPYLSQQFSALLLDSPS
jgi:V/A-type H+-transporting ATPase subunit E